MTALSTVINGIRLADWLAGLGAMCFVMAGWLMWWLRGAR